MEFEYNRNKILANLIYGFSFLIFTIFITIMIIRKLILEWNEFSLYKIIFALISIVLLSTLTFLFLGTALIRNKYFKQNLKEEVKLNKNERKIIVLNKLNNTKTEINFSDVTSVELHYSWNTNPFSSDLGYSKLNIRNKKNPIIITQNNINQYHIYRIFKNKVEKNKSSFMNNL